MFRRQKSGSVLCTSCGKLVGVKDEVCWNCGKRNPGLWGFAPVLKRLGSDFGFVPIVMGGCSALYIATLLVDPGGVGMRGMSILSPSFQSVFMFGASGSLPVFLFGRWWTLLSAGWLHANLLHIMMNLLWVRQLAPETAGLYGAPRAMIIYTVASASGFALSSAAGLLMGASPLPFLRGAQYTLGASAAVFGLLGALVAYGRRGGTSHISGQAMTYAVVLFVFGLIMPGIDNYAHLGGFIGGYGCSLWLNPLKPERTSHMLAAVLCVAATALSIVASIVQRVVLL